MLRWWNTPTLFHARARARALSSDRSSHVYKHLQALKSSRTSCNLDCFKILDSAPTRYQVKLKGRCTLGGKSQQHVSKTRRSDKITACVQENFCENLCLCNRILSPQQFAQILFDLNFCNILLRQNSVAETKIFTKILLYTRIDFVATTCLRDMLLRLAA